ncbi:MAG: hypothetical protein A3J67_03560 [Parcubacteria group bacterium RIFCSPHIGHO2_02_FULL_48_10b]|nr:MAG: hypothetical protein A3J67_03560 [Parcubacteria group bacterium RIFCSPHIGHO2_02_FULL_48_10b]
MNNHPKEEIASSVSGHHGANTRLPKTITVKNAVIAAIILILLALAYYEKGLLIAATVNGSPISRLAVIQALEKRSGKAALDSLITQKLIVDEASKKGIKVTDAEIATEIKNIESQIAAQGGTLPQMLEQQGLTMDDLKEQIGTQKKVEGLLGDAIQVTDAEVAKYIKDNKVTVPKGQETDTNNQIREQLKQTKFQSAIQPLLDSLHTQAKINYFVKY